MPGFETDFSAAILKKKVPLMIVSERSQADYIVSANSNVDRAGWAKTIFVSPLPSAHASITVKSAKDGVLVFAYAVDKANAVHSSQSTAEACAKHLKSIVR